MQPAPKKQKTLYSVIPAAGAFAIEADDRALKTPAGADFIVPTQKLAAAIAAEWQAQTDKIDPVSMPLTQLAATAIDIAGKKRTGIIDQLVAYVGSELLCHFAEQPAGLVKRQEEIWQPILDWCEQNFDDIILQTGTGIMPIPQAHETFFAMREAIGRYDAFALTGLREAVDTSGSLVLGLALAEKHLTAVETLNAAELDSLFQIEKWGEDPAAIKRRSAIKEGLSQCETWFGLLS